MKKYFFLALALIIFSASACKKNPEGGAEKGYATGKAVDSKGNPLANVDVTMENKLPGSSNSFNGKTDKNGNYKIKVATVGNYHASAYLIKTFNGQEYRLPLHANDDEVFSNEGAVRNFTLKLSGPMYGSGYYGRSIEISHDLLSPSIPDEENIEFTFTPIGNLIDGYPGSVLNLKPTQVSSYAAILDIPIGRYTVSAKYNGAVLRLSKRDSGDPYQNSVTIDFPGSIFEGLALSYK